MTLLFMIASLIFLNILFEVIFFRHWISEGVVFTFIMIVSLIVIFFVYYPTHVVLEADGVLVKFPLHRRKKILYDKLKEFTVDDLLKSILLTLKAATPMEFFYSEDELGQIRSILQTHGIPERREGDDSARS